LVVVSGMLMCLLQAGGTPANKLALEKHYDKFLAKDLARCTTCHLPSDIKNPESLDEFPHNPFGARLRIVGKQLAANGQKKDIPRRLQLLAREDSDGDGVDNETELLLGHNPGDARDTPSQKELTNAQKRRAEFRQFLASYRWRPFDPVARPPVPSAHGSWALNPIDKFIAAEQRARGLKPRPEASKEVLLRRVYLDLIGLSPTPEELQAFETDRSPKAYEHVVDRLLADGRYGERWGRHWMDVWRYSDWAGWTGGNQIRDSKPHIWRWRDWIIESLNEDKGYDRMILEMLAADELAPEDTNALRATGFLVRNYKMLSREQWLEDTVKHTSQAFLGLTMGCAKCHDHMYDPISQAEYYQMRAVFEPYQVRTDRIPGELDTSKDGLVRVYDTATNAPTFFFIRGDERRPDTNRIMKPDVPKALGGKLDVDSVKLPPVAAFPDKREFVVRETIAASEKAMAEARAAFVRLQTNSAARKDKLREQELLVEVAEAKHASLLAVLRAEQLESDGKGQTEVWEAAAKEAKALQQKLALSEARLALQQAKLAQLDAQKKADEAAAKAARTNQDLVPVANTKSDSTKLKKEAEKSAKDLETAKQKTTEAEKALAEATKQSEAAPTTAYKRRPTDDYPAISTGRRLAFAQWLANQNNPLTARVAMNQVWLRHFGQGIVASPADFGRNGKAPSHPQLLDWLAAEFMSQGWKMKAMHRLILTSRTYRMAATPDAADAKIDPDNVFLWRMPSRRMEAELVRDNLLYVAGDLDSSMGGADIDNALGLSSRRRSIYLRTAAEKEVEFLKIFDGASVTECYARRPTVVPQQALALANSELTLKEARLLAGKLAETAGSDLDKFVECAFLRILARHPTPDELKLCRSFLERRSQGLVAAVAAAHATPKAAAPDDGLARMQRARENLIAVLFNHNDFVTIR